MNKILISITLLITSHNIIACQCLNALTEKAKAEQWKIAEAVLIAKPINGHFSGDKVSKNTKETSNEFNVIESLSGSILPNTTITIYQRYYSCWFPVVPNATYLIRLSNIQDKLFMHQCGRTLIALDEQDKHANDLEWQTLRKRITMHGNEKLKRVRAYLHNKSVK